MLVPSSIATVLDRRIRLGIVALLAVACIISGWALYNAYRQPIRTEEDVPAYSYEHEATLNYELNVESPTDGRFQLPGASYDYPASAVNGIEVSAFYGFTGSKPAEVNGTYKITALLSQDGVPLETRSLVPETEKRVPVFSHEQKADIDYSIHLRPNSIYDLSTIGPDQTYFVNLVDRIEGSASYEFKSDKPADISGSYDITAYLEAEQMPSRPFPIVPVPGEATGTDYYVQTADLQYTVKLKPNTLYEEPTLAPGQAYFAKLVDVLDCIAGYTFDTDTPLRSLTGRYTITGTLEARGAESILWKKTLLIVPESRFHMTSDQKTFSQHFTIDPAALKETATEIAVQTGMAVRDLVLTVEFNIAADAELQSGTVRGSLRPTMVVDLTGSQFRVLGALSQRSVGSTSSKTPEIQRRLDFSSKNSVASVKEDFTVDLAPYRTRLRQMEDEIGMPLRNPKLVIRFNVDSRADSEYGVVEDKLAPYMVVPLSGKTFQVEGELSQTRTGAIEHIEKQPEEVQFRAIGPEAKNIAISETFQLDLPRYRGLLEALKSEGPAASDGVELLLTFDIHAIGKTEGGDFEESLSPTMVVPLTGNVKIGGNRSDADSANLTRTVGIFHPAVQAQRRVWLISSIACVVLLLCSVMLTRSKPVQHDGMADALRRITKKHGDRIAQSSWQPSANEGSTIHLNSMEDLVKIADELGKPIVHRAGNGAWNQHVYFVSDGSTRYEYFLAP